MYCIFYQTRVPFKYTTTTKFSTLFYFTIAPCVCACLLLFKQPQHCSSSLMLFVIKTTKEEKKNKRDEDFICPFLDRMEPIYIPKRPHR